MTQQNSLVGHTLGQYQILDELGRGGMAAVYRAWQPSLRRYVALKVLFPHLSDKGFVRRFQQEAVVAANLSHPNIVTIYEVAQQNGYLYIAMEYIEGRPLSQVIVEDGVLPLDRLLHILQQVAGALDYAHRRHFVHRDIKPANILVTAEDRAVVTDFGIAKALEGSGATAQLTATGTIMGTPAYMSPEQIQGLPVDYRTDLYSLGIVCYEMLGGRPPFGGTTTAAVLYAQVNDIPPGIRQINPDVPRSVERVLERMLAKRPEDRFPSAGAFVTALSGSGPTNAPSSHTPSNARVSTATAPAMVQSQRQRKLSAPVMILGIAAIVVLLALIALVAVLVSGPASSTDRSMVTLTITTLETPPLTEGGGLGLPGDIAFDSDRDGDYEIYVLDAGTGEVRQLTDNPATDKRPDWSPDGRKVAFQSNRDGNYEIYVMDANGGNVQRLTHNTTDDLRPIWSPDGQKIVFEANRDGNPEIYVMNADGGNSVRLTNHPATDWAPSWSPDGRDIVFISNREAEDNTFGIYVMSADGRNVKRLTNLDFDNRSPSWSPDGKQIVFVSNRAKKNWDIYVMSVEGESVGLMRLTESPGRDWNPVWSPNGKKIIFNSDREGNKELYIMDWDGANEERLTHDPADDSYPRCNPH